MTNKITQNTMEYKSKEWTIVSFNGSPHIVTEMNKETNRVHLRPWHRPINAAEVYRNAIHHEGVFVLEAQKEKKGTVSISYEEYNDLEILQLW